MAQSTILALGYLAAASSDVVVAAGASVNIGAFTSSGTIPADLQLSVMSDSPGADVLVGLITPADRVVSVNGPGTFRILRPLIDATVPVGVFLESA